MEKKSKKPTRIIIFLIIIAFLFVGKTALTSFNDHTYVATVTNKERVSRYSGKKHKSYYLIFCKDDKGNYYEFKNEDCLIRGKINSSNVYNRLEIGKTYKFTVVGYRIWLFSWYENIIKFEEVT